jgi:hypothetical protein
MLIKDANEITGKLSNTEKMPCKSYNIPAKNCNVGSKLAKVIGSVCYGCYALKGRYLFSNVLNAMKRRLDSIDNPLWVKAMSVFINKQSPNYFRWHDSGDIQGINHLKKIVEVCENTPNCKHWLPTREYNLIRKYIIEVGDFPSNLIVRVSIHMVDDFKAPKIPNVEFSAVSKEKTPSSSTYICPAEENKIWIPMKNHPKGGEMSGPRCGDCRKCWNTGMVVYKYH